MVFVRVAVNVTSVSGEYDYSLPPELEGQVQAGCLVRVPFGSQMAQGVVLQFVDQPSVEQTRSVLELLDPLPVLDQAQIEFSRALAEHTFNPLSAIINIMLPPGLIQHADTVYRLSDRWIEQKPINMTEPSYKSEGISQKFSETQQRLLDLFKSRGALRGRQIDRHFHSDAKNIGQRVDWRKSAQGLVRQSILTAQSILPPPTVRPKFILTAQLAVTPEQAGAAMVGLGKTPATLQRRQSALRFLVSEPEPVAVSWVYAQSGCNLADLQELAERELIILLECEIFRDSLLRVAAQNSGSGVKKLTDIEQTDEQKAALEQIYQALQPRIVSFRTGLESDPTHQPFLLYGVTGSGKTEIYLRAAAETIRQGKSVMILVPEIAITPQIVRRFLAHFPGQVGLVHSKLSDGERYDTWRRARAGKLKIIIGPRSALFSPLQNLGLIVLDECHDNSYFQSEPPFYHAVPAAEMYARIKGAVCILGSATPSVDLRYRSLLDGTRSVSRNGLQKLELHQRFQTSTSGGQLGELPPVTVVDMREELKTGNRGIFSRQLLEALAETLAHKQQAILFLNRRGTATYVFCRDCGYVVKCPNCETPLTYHVGMPDSAEVVVDDGKSRFGKAAGNSLVCHRCNYRRQLPSACPECKSQQIRTYGLGSERVESEIKLLIPNARVLRWDWETTREKDAHEMIMMHFANHQADILVGTQMLAKGLDLPLVTLVGIILADVGLTLPDPFGLERTFQLLTQVAGRAGRSELGGQVILQTFMPENPVIQMASRHDFDAFYFWELENRRNLGYPPFAQLIRLEYRHRDADEAELQARNLAEKLRKIVVVEQRSESSIIGPVPCFFSRDNGIYRWQIILRGPDPAGIIKNKIPDGWRVEIDPVSLL